VHHRVNPYLGARRQNEQLYDSEEFLVHEKKQTGHTTQGL